MFEVLADPLVYITGSIFILLIGMGLYLLIQGGIFTPIDVETRSEGLEPIDIAYKFAKGSMEDSGPLFTEAHSILPDRRTIGVYYTSKQDDSKVTDKSEMRHIVGVILNDPGKEVSDQEKEELKEFGYSFAQFPKVGNSVQTTFPFRSSISVIISVHRVYPAINRYMESKKLCGHPVMEVYDSDLGTIFFIVPLEKQDKFYVPEAKYLLDYIQGSCKDDNSTVSFDDSSSFFRSDEADVDSVVDDCSVNQDCTRLPEWSQKEKAAPDEVFGSSTVEAKDCKSFDRKVLPSESSEHTDESEETDSSFEKIDRREAMES